MPEADRRTVLIAAAAGAAVTLAPALARAAEGGAVAVFEAEEPAARQFAQAQAAKGGSALAIDGDTARFARRLFREQRPARVAGLTRYADFLVLAESAREEGYRAELAAPASEGGPALFLWTAARIDARSA